MTISNRLTVSSILLVLAVMLAIPTGAWAQRKALISVRVGQELYPSAMAANTLTTIPTVANTTKTASIGATATTPTIMIPAGVLAGTGTLMVNAENYGYTMGTPNGLYFVNRLRSWSNEPWTLEKSWTAAAGQTQTFQTAGTYYGYNLLPPNGITVSGTIFDPSNRGAHSNCFSRGMTFAAPVTTGGTAMLPVFDGFPAECDNASRGGSLARAPGAKKFGGAVRLLFSDNQTGKFNAPFGLFSFTGLAQSAMPSGLDASGVPDKTPAPSWRTGISVPGKMGNHNVQFYSFLVGGATSIMNNQVTVMPWTTGRGSVRNADYYSTSIARQGSNTFNTTNLTGMISLVQPILFQGWTREGNSYAGQTISGAVGSVWTTTITFAGEVPEPGTLAMLGFGALGLAGLSRLRMRKG